MRNDRLLHALGLCAKAIVQYYFDNNEEVGSVVAYENTLG